ncbi:hypothetical protein ABIB25_005168 [Nakamurella sp. UYEF19]
MQRPEWTRALFRNAKHPEWPWYLQARSLTGNILQLVVYGYFTWLGLDRALSGSRSLGGPPVALAVAVLALCLATSCLASAVWFLRHPPAKSEG